MRKRKTPKFDKTKQNVVTLGNNTTIPAGYGIRNPIARKNENYQFMPLAFTVGSFTPLGVGTMDYFASTHGATFTIEIVNRIRDLGFLSSATITTARLYFSAVANLIAAVHSYNDLLRISSNASAQHNLTAIMSTSEAISGTTIAKYRKAVAALAHLPFHQPLYDAFIRGLTATTTSKSAYAPIRMFMYRPFIEDIGLLLNSHYIGQALEAALHAVYDNRIFIQEVSQVLPNLKLNLPNPQLGNAIEHNPAAYQNIMNLPHTFVLDESDVTDMKPLFYMDNIEEDGLFTISYEEDAYTPDRYAGSLWNSTSLPVSGVSEYYFDDAGLVKSVMSEPLGLALFGAAHTDPLHVTTPAINASTNYTDINPIALYDGIASKLLTL